jgi:hypothetical protein
VYLINWAVCVILITLYLVKNDRELLAGRVQAGPVAETQKNQKIIQSLASLCFIALFIVPGLDYRFGWSNVPPIVSLIADGFVAVGFYIVFLTFKENSYTRATIEVSQGQTGHHQRSVSLRAASDVRRGFRPVDLHTAGAGVVDRGSVCRAVNPGHRSQAAGRRKSLTAKPGRLSGILPESSL